MYTAQEVISNKFWIVLNKNNKIGTVRFNDDGVYEFFDQRDNTKRTLTDFDELFTVEENTRDHHMSDVDTNIQGYPSGFSAPIPAEHPSIPAFKKSENANTLFAAGYYIIQFKRWLPSFAPKVATLEKYPYRGPFPTEWEMNLELKKSLRD